MLIFGLIFLIHWDVLICTGNSSDTKYTNSNSSGQNGVATGNKDKPSSDLQNLPPSFTTYSNFVVYTTISNSEDAPKQPLKTNSNNNQPHNDKIHSDSHDPNANKNQDKTSVNSEPIQIGNKFNQFQQHSMTDAAKTDKQSLVSQNNDYHNSTSGAVRIEPKPQYQAANEFFKIANKYYNNDFDPVNKKQSIGDDDQNVLVVHEPVFLIVHPPIDLPSSPDFVHQNKKDVKKEDDDQLRSSKKHIQKESNEDINDGNINNNEFPQKKDKVTNRSIHFKKKLPEEEDEEEGPANLDDIIEPEFDSSHFDTKATKERVKYTHNRPTIRSVNSMSRSTLADNDQQDSSWEEDDMAFSYGDDELGPSHWPLMYKHCVGNRQSPINIETPTLNTIKMRPLRWNSIYFQKPKRMTLRNTGRELVLRMCFHGQSVPKLSGGPLHKVYKLRSIKFHWGMNDLVGSEHQIDDATYPMEMHAVHSCGSEEVAENVVIVAYFLQVGDTDSEPIEHILKVFVKALKHPEREIPLRNTFNLAELVRPFTSEFVLYMGSFTIPPCQQGVKWIVYPYPLNISRDQLQRFREVCEYAPKLMNNFRPVQPICNRRVCFAI